MINFHSKFCEDNFSLSFSPSLFLSLSLYIYIYTYECLCVCVGVCVCVYGWLSKKITSFLPILSLIYSNLRMTCLTSGSSEFRKTPYFSKYFVSTMRNLIGTDNKKVNIMVSHIHLYKLREEERVGGKFTKEYNFTISHHHYVGLPAQISLTLSRHLSLSSTAPGRSSSLHFISSNLDSFRDVW